jgi:hypothetical protein
MSSGTRAVRIAGGGLAAALALATAGAGAAATSGPAAAPAAAATGAQGDLDKKVQSAADGRGPQVSIPFADHGGIRDWRAIDRNTLLVEGNGNRWYRVELFSPCFELPFADRVGFKSNVTGEFDRFSSVIVRGQRCQVQSVTSAPPPPKKPKKGEDPDAAAKAPAAPRTGAADKPRTP